MNRDDLIQACREKYVSGRAIILLYAVLVGGMLLSASMIL